MKKIIALLIILAIGFNLINVGAFFPLKNSTEVNNNKEIQLLSYLGVFDSYPQQDVLLKQITRIEFAEYLAKAIDCFIEERPEFLPSYYYDVTDAPYLDLLTQKGIFKGREDKLFHPEAYITKTEACIALLRVLGYEPLAKARGGRETDYIRISNEIKLTKGVSPKTALTMQELITILYNALVVPVLKTESIAGSNVENLNVTYTTDEEDNLLAQLYDIHFYSGIVNSNEYTSINGYEITDDSQIRVDDNVFRYYLRTNGLIGREVELFYRKDETDTGTVVVLTPTDEDFLEILSDDVLSFENGALKYRDKNGKSRNINITDETIVQYNGKVHTSDYKSLFDFSDGIIRLYKVNSGNYNVIHITQFENVVVKQIDLLKEVIYTKREYTDEYHKLDLKENVEYSIYSTKNKNVKLTLGSILNDNLCSVSMSKDKTLMEIYVSSTSISGKVEAIGEAENGKTICVGGEEYVVSPQYTGLEYVLGEHYTFYFDVMGKVALCTYSDKEKSTAVGYLYEFGEFRDKGKRLYLSVFTENGKHLSLPVSRKVSFNGDKIESEELESAFLHPVTGEVVKQLIQFTVNSNEEISKIYTVAESEEQRLNDTAVYRIADKRARNFDYEFQMLGSNIPVDATTKFIVVPSFSGHTEEDYTLWSYSQYETPFQHQYHTECFKYDDSTVQADYVLIYVDSIKYPVVPFFMLVDSIRYILSPDGTEYVGEIYGYVNGGFTSLVVDSSCDISDIEKGDLIRFATNAVGDIKLAGVIVDQSNLPDWMEEITQDSDGKMVFNLSILFGQVLSVDRAKDENRVLLTLGENGVEKELLVLDPSKAKVLVYDENAENGKKVYIGTIDEIVDYKTNPADCDRIFVQDLWDYHKLIVLYK